MKRRYTIMVINYVFENESMLIVKSEGSQAIKRYDDTITNEDLNVYLEQDGIDIDDCIIYVVEEDWKGSPRINKC